MTYAIPTVTGAHPKMEKLFKTILELLCLEFSYWRLGTWYLVRGTCYVVLGTWYLLRGTWYVVLGTWYLSHDQNIPCHWRRRLLKKYYFNRNLHCDYKDDTEINWQSNVSLRGSFQLNNIFVKVDSSKALSLKYVIISGPRRSKCFKMLTELSVKVRLWWYKRWNKTELPILTWFNFWLFLLFKMGSVLHLSVRWAIIYSVLQRVIPGEWRWIYKVMKSTIKYQLIANWETNNWKNK